MAAEDLLSCLLPTTTTRTRCASTRRARRSAPALRRSPQRSASRFDRPWAACSPQDIVPPINVPAHDNSAMDGYAVRFADLEPTAKRAEARSATRSPASPSAATVGAGECVRILTGGVMPQGADTVVMQEVAQDADGGVRHGRAGTEEGAERALRRRRPEGRQSRSFDAGQDRPRRPRHDRLARHRRSHGVAQAARRVLLHRRRARLDRHAARGRRDLRLQPLHAARHARAPRLSSRSTWASCAMIRALERAFAQRRRSADVVITIGRRIGRRSRLRQAADGQARRSDVLEDRHAPRPADGVRPHRQRASFRPARQSGRGDGHLLPVRARRAAAPLGRSDASRSRCCKVPHAAAMRKVPGRTEYPARRPLPTKTANGKCAPPASRARACCARCRRRTASSCSSTRAARSRPANRSPYSFLRA